MTNVQIRMSNEKEELSPALDISSPLIFSTDCVIARMRSQNNDLRRYFGSREELCSEPGEVGKCHEGIFQQAVSDSSLDIFPPHCLGRTTGSIRGFYPKKLASPPNP
ncbi:hypothetical protein Enr8_25970 [Blastopirellula retiformator]|uniref:Uncharacterized protein n=1 Tax=Blastopirellula retiformator TaxID=2527970 RepID=A0A5C5V334_9BACT|nr:hypothetical protein Enr8_25970 [Blastopirellula retiformator]